MSARDNMLPEWRAIHLGYMRQLRMMIRDGRQAFSARLALKEAQRRAARARCVWYNS